MSDVVLEFPQPYHLYRFRGSECGRDHETDSGVDHDRLRLELRDAGDKLIVLAIARRDYELHKAVESFVVAADRCILQAGGL